jgi:aminodeoxyfutalosine deaminase
MAFRLPVRATLASATRYELAAPILARGALESVDCPPADAPAWIAIPGLRNAHVHLDLSEIRGVPRARDGFARWVLDLLRARGPFDAAALARGAASGARAALAAGTTAVVDIDSSGAAAAVVAASGLKGIACRELLGRRDPAAITESVAQWVRDVGRGEPQGALRGGVSPHAPYSTPPALYRAACEIVARTGCGYTAHLAETTAEREYLRTGGGEFRDLLAHLGAEPPFAAPPGRDPVAYVTSLAPLPSGALLAHVNHPSDGDFPLLRAAAAIVVYCPRSHAFFGHSRHPIRELLAAGVRVALGTDSLASNGTLSLLDELAYLRAARPDLPLRTIFHAATAAAAREIDGGSGELVAGEPADLAVLATRGGIPGDLGAALEAVTEGSATVVATIVGGVVRYVAPFATAEFASLTGVSSPVS